MRRYPRLTPKYLPICTGEIVVAWTAYYGFRAAKRTWVNEAKATPRDQEGSVRSASQPGGARPEDPGLPGWPGEQSRYFTVIDIALMALGTVIICGQMVPVPPIDYEDPLYLVHSPYVHVSAAFRDALKLARQADPSSSDSEPLESEIESIEHYLSVRLATQ